MLAVGARYRDVTVLDDGRKPSSIPSGPTPEEAQLQLALPGEQDTCARLSSLPEPLRVADVVGCTRDLGPPEVDPPSHWGRSCRVGHNPPTR